MGNGAQIPASHLVVEVCNFVDGHLWQTPDSALILICYACLDPSSKDGFVLKLDFYEVHASGVPPTTSQQRRQI